MTRRAPIHGRPKLVALDNDTAVLRAISDLLDPWYDVLETRDARRAFAWVRQYAAVQAVITERFTSTVAGLSVLEAVRTLRPQVRRVMLTDHADLAGLVHGLHRGIIDRLVPKPFTQDDLLSAVRPDAVAVHRLPQAPVIDLDASRRASA